MLERGASITLMAAVGAAAAPVSQYAWIAQLMPMVVGVIMVCIVRALIDMQSAKKKAWQFNILVMTMCSIFTAVFVHEYALTTGQAMMFGMGTGATGIGIISFGKPVLLAIVGKVQEGLKTPPTSE